MTPEEIEKKAKELGVPPGEFLKKLNDAAEEVAVEVAANSAHPVVKMQHVIISLADGRRGVFMGPELIKEAEMKLGIVPKLVSVDFDPPRAVAMPIPRETPVTEASESSKEMPNADTPIEPTPAAGLE